MTPLATTISTGDEVQLILNVSGGKGLTSGSFDLRIDPKLKLVNAEPGDFLTNENGSVNQTVNADGSVKITFNRPTTASDSGALVVLDLQALNTGNAPVLVQSGRYLSGNTPVPARVVNALVTVE